jgi:hypothetical protein
MCIIKLHSCIVPVGGDNHRWQTQTHYREPPVGRNVLPCRIRGGGPGGDSEADEAENEESEVDDVYEFDQGELDLEIAALMDEHLDEDEDRMEPMGVADEINEALADDPEAQVFDEEEMEVLNQAAVQEAQNPATKYQRHPYHYTLGKIANSHQMDLQLIVTIGSVDGDENATPIVRCSLVLKHPERSVHGSQLYGPAERSRLSRRSLSKQHTLLMGYSALAQKLLQPGTIGVNKDTLEKNQELFLKMTIWARNILDGYRLFYQDISNDRMEVRLEYAFVEMGLLNQESLPPCPIDMHHTDYWPFGAILMAKAADVKDDVGKVQKYALEPVEALAGMLPEMIGGLTPEIKTAFVHMAEIVQQLVNSTDPGIQGTHRTLIKMSETESNERLKVPLQRRRVLSNQERELTKLPFGLDPKLLPLAPMFNGEYCPAANQDPIPGLWDQLMKERADQLHNPYMWIRQQRRLHNLFCTVFHGIVPGHEGMQIPGVMEPADYTKWLDLTTEEKIDTIRRLAQWLVELYDEEFNYLLEKKLEKDKNHPGNQALLHYIRRKRRNGNFMIQTARDVARLKHKYGDQSVLKLDDRPGEIIKTKGKSR